MLALVLGSGVLAIGWLEAAARTAHAALRTEAALAAARDALVGYAASYPDQHGGRHGPGYLPCPDRTGNGSPNTPCSRKSLGRLPWRRLGLHDPRDAAGERLWYALADHFRANGRKFRPLDSAAPAELVVDGGGGVAAVVFAPGPPLSFQDRARGRFDPAQYLEGGNEAAGDSTFASGPPAPLPSGGSVEGRFNDRVVAISRDELMAAAGRRALAAVRSILEEYRGAPWNTGAMPWLVPWSDPAETVVPTPGTTVGRLPVAPVGGEVPTSFRVTGAPAGGSVSASGTVAAADAGLPGHPLAVAAGRCTWTAEARIDCEGESRIVLGPGRERVVRLDLHFTGDTAVSPPTSSDVRRRTVRAAAWTAESRIAILDRAAGTVSGRGEVRFAPGPLDGALAVEGVAHPLGAGEEVPEWLLDNEWRRAVLVGSAPAFAPGGGAACGAPGGCLELERTALGVPRRARAAAAVAVLAGPALRRQDRGAAGLAMWFEGENANPANLRYEARHASERFNDRVAVVSEGPGRIAP